MIEDALDHRWIENFEDQYNRRPVVMPYFVKNQTAEHINTQTFIKDLERAFINSGLVSVVSSPEQRDLVRNELSQQNLGFTLNPAQIGRETGADFVLIGEINSIEDSAGGERVIYYQINLELIHVESSEKVWIGEHKIKKLIDQDELSF